MSENSGKIPTTISPKAMSSSCLFYPTNSKKKKKKNSVYNDIKQKTQQILTFNLEPNWSIIKIAGDKSVFNELIVSVHVG